MTEPYYEDPFVTIYHGDATEVTDWLQGDVLISDPPYGMAYVSNSSKYGSTDAIDGDGDASLRDSILERWAAVSEDRPALVFGTWRVPRPAGVRQLIVWDKGDSPGMGDLSMPWGPGHEEIYVLGDGWTGKRRTNVIRVNTIGAQDKDRPKHPTPKPLSLMRQLIEYAPPGIIVYPFMGSGTTLRAAKDLGRKAIGIDTQEKYCAVAAARMGQEVLF